MDFRKSLYILPNLFTLASVMCGFAALALASEAGGADAAGNDLYLAALAICFGIFFDTVDGRVARLTRTQTDLGRDLDSLADVITFGAAPALLVYKWGLTSFGRTGMFIAGLFVCAGALRLARFNVLERRQKTVPAGAAARPSKYTVGLSIPPAASVLVFMVIVSHNAGQYRAVSESSIAAIVVVLSLLMVSRVRFRSFKDVRLTRRTIAVILLVLGASSAIYAAGFKKGFVFLVLVSTYIALGLTEEIVFFRRRRREGALAGQSTSTPAPPAGEPLDDEAVLRELGAFDQEGDGGDGGTSGGAESGGPGAVPGRPARQAPG